MHRVSDLGTYFADRKILNVLVRWLQRLITNSLSIEHKLEKETWVIFLKVFPVDFYQYGYC